MRIGLISDVHGNAPALDAVLAELGDVEVIHHCGDVVGYNPFPREVIDRFREADIRTIQGNHDRKISTDVEEMGTAPAAAGEGSSPGAMARRSGRWTYEQLSATDLEWLASLPEERTILDGRVKFVHGAPGSQDERFYPEDYHAGRLDGERVLVHGHTHVQHREPFDTGDIVNPGSVGQPRDGDPRAAYAVLDTAEFEISLHRVEYPIERVEAAIQASELPDQLCRWLEAGRIVNEA